MEILVSQTTVNDHSVAKILAKKLVSRKLAACVSISAKVESIYYWNNEIQDEEEFILTIKTLEQKLGDLESFLIEEHPYDVPEFIVIKTLKCSKAYFDWIKSSLNS